MARILTAAAQLQWPVLGFPKDGDVLSFFDTDLLTEFAPRIVDRDRHLDMELVDMTGRRWIVLGIHRTEPPVRRWWRFSWLFADSQVREQFELEEVEPIPFEATRERLYARAARVFHDDPQQLAEVRDAQDMDALSTACIVMNLRQIPQDVLAKGASARIRTSAEVARRAIVLFAVVGVATAARHRLARRASPDRGDRAARGSASHRYTAIEAAIDRFRLACRGFGPSPLGPQPRRTAAPGSEMRYG